MKFFAFIMASGLLALSILPCADEDFTPKDGKVRTEITEQHNEQDHSEHNEDCSPFCHCTCCAGFSITHPFATGSPLMLINSKLYTSYLSEDLFEYSPPIWQPPQLNV